MTIYTFRLIVRPQYGVGFHVFHEFSRILIKYPNSRIIEQKLDEFNSPGCVKLHDNSNYIVN